MLGFAGTGGAAFAVAGLVEGEGGGEAEAADLEAGSDLESAEAEAEGLWMRLSWKSKSGRVMKTLMEVWHA